MKITQKICESVRIYNEHQYADGHPYLYYQAAERGRIYRSARWSVAQDGKSFSDFWQDYGSMTFPVYQRIYKWIKFSDAQAWMRNRFGFTDFLRTPMGSWMEKSFVEKRNKEIEEKYKSLKQSTGA